MATYAVLGATGNCGQSLLTVLGDRSANINCFVRSKKKLEGMSPEIASRSNVNIFEGSISGSDEEVPGLTACLKGTHAAFLAVAATLNTPGCSIAQDTARSVVASLRKLKEQDSLAKLPRLVILSSASTSEQFSKDLPPIARWVLHTGASNIYADLELAEKYLRSESDLVSTTFVKPGGMVHDAQKGHELSTERQQTFLGWLDLAAGMMEIADSEGDTWAMKEVSVVPTAKDVKIEWRVPYFMFIGFLCHFLPGLYWLWSKAP